MIKRSGFSMVEVLVALAIAAIAISMFAYFTDSLRLTKVSKQETAAAAYARNYLDSLKSKWQFGSDYTYNLAALSSLSNLPEGYTASVEVKNQDDTLIMSYPSGTMPAYDSSPMRKITISLKDQEGKAIVMSTNIAFPRQER